MFSKINEEELEKVKIELETTPLNLVHIGRIFGQPFWELMILVQTNISIDPKGKTKIEIILPK